MYLNELERRLDQIWIGSYKIRVNCSRFFRNKAYMGAPGNSRDTIGSGRGW